MNLEHLPHFAILSGVFGTAASVFGKLISYSEEYIKDIEFESNQTVWHIFLPNAKTKKIESVKNVYLFVYRNYFGDGR